MAYSTIEDRLDSAKAGFLLLAVCFLPTSIANLIYQPGFKTEYVMVRAESKCRDGVLSEHIWPHKTVCVYAQPAHGSVVRMESPKTGDYLFAGFLDHPLGKNKGEAK
jgi:hypothetical protein